MPTSAMTRSDMQWGVNVARHVNEPHLQLRTDPGRLRHTPTTNEGALACLTRANEKRHGRRQGSVAGQAHHHHDIICGGDARDLSFTCRDQRRIVMGRRDASPARGSSFNITLAAFALLSRQRGDPASTSCHPRGRQGAPGSSSHDASLHGSPVCFPHARTDPFPR